MPTARFKTLSRMIRRLRPQLRLTPIRMVIAPTMMILLLMVIGVIIATGVPIVRKGVKPILVPLLLIKTRWLSMIPDLVDADVIIHTIWIIVGVIMVIARSIILASAILQDIGRMVASIVVIHMTTLSIPMRYVRDVRANAVMYVFLIALLRWLALVNFVLLHRIWLVNKLITSIKSTRMHYKI
jgi:hypothetical protein|nr:MAG TPA: hypothetical protein [Caudoviricetes sp.]